MTEPQAVSVAEALQMEPCSQPEEGQPLTGPDLLLRGWVKQFRMAGSGDLMFLHLGDGLSMKRIQVVFEVPSGYDAKITFESSVEVIGKLVVSPAKGQAVELKASQVILVGACDPDSYPFSKGKKAHPMEHLRGFPQLRPKTQIISAITRVKHRMFKASHDFYDEQDFTWIQTPIITKSDCEGGGEAFAVTSPSEPKFFREMKAFLTVSGQLHVEPYACALGKVYTLGPSFRAEKSQTTRHLSEFWMLEPELAFHDLEQTLVVIEDYFKAVILKVLAECPDELSLCAQRFKRPDLQETLKRTAEEPFAKVTYLEALKLLKASGRTFEKPCEWGVDFGSDQEKYLCDEVFKKPTFITHYPAHIKAFYMYQDDLPPEVLDRDPKLQTVACVDCLFPGIGEVVGGSQREHRYEILQTKIVEAGLDPALYDWYLDTRRYGSVPHSGFGVGLDRLLRFLTGADHIMDLVPYPVRFEHLSS